MSGSSSCSRVAQSNFVTASECTAFLSLAEPLMPAASAKPTFSFFLNQCVETGDVLAILFYCRCRDTGRESTLLSPPLTRRLLNRLLERMRRAVAHEYGLPLADLRPDLSFLSRVSAVEAYTPKMN